MSAIAATVGVSQIERSTRWYSVTLGMSIEREYDEDEPCPSARLERDGFRLDLLSVGRWTLPQGSATASAQAVRRAAATGLIQLAFLVPDLDAAVRRVGAFNAIAEGSRLLHAPRLDHEWGVRFATVMDPDGGIVQLVERVAVPA